MALHCNLWVLFVDWIKWPPIPKIQILPSHPNATPPSHLRLFTPSEQSPWLLPILSTLFSIRASAPVIQWPPCPPLRSGVGTIPGSLQWQNSFPKCDASPQKLCLIEKLRTSLIYSSTFLHDVQEGQLRDKLVKAGDHREYQAPRRAQFCFFPFLSLPMQGPGHLCTLETSPLENYALRKKEMQLDFSFKCQKNRSPGQLSSLFSPVCTCYQHTLSSLEGSWAAIPSSLHTINRVFL